MQTECEQLKNCHGATGFFWKKALIFNLVILMLMAAGSLWVAANIGESKPLPIHWGMDGKPDAYANGWIALWQVPGMLLFTCLIFIVIPFIEPRKTNLHESQKAYSAIWALFQVCSKKGLRKRV